MGEGPHRGPAEEVGEVRVRGGVEVVVGPEAGISQMGSWREGKGSNGM